MLELVCEVELSCADTVVVTDVGDVEVDLGDGGVVHLPELQLPQHHVYHGHQRPREVVEVSQVGEEDHEDHHESYDHPDIGDQDLKYFECH